MKQKDGEDHQVLSAHGANTLASDKRAFVRLMTHLRDHDAANTVIMVQVENETGSYRVPRDYGRRPTACSPGRSRPLWPAPPAQRHRPRPWRAGRLFQHWYTRATSTRLPTQARRLPPPMYVNAAGRAVEPARSAGVASGGPQQDRARRVEGSRSVIDLAAPDIYDGKSDNVLVYLDKYNRPDNALMVPEIGNAALFGRYFYAALGRDDRLCARSAWTAAAI
jgi:hypothetical protein